MRVALVKAGTVENVVLADSVAACVAAFGPTYVCVGLSEDQPVAPGYLWDGTKFTAV